ncbi:hypothetical protein JXB28_02850 [Candidatus Woesearchaeota archaeon]|nr:hypothetical protein [Candidatus Woesearchaeota archaeon]
MGGKKKGAITKEIHVIGVDLDNTIVSYDESMHELATSLGLIGSQTPKDKTAIRNSIRQKPNGENEWQKLQALVYGKEMGKAKLVEGVADFFLLCKKHDIPVYIISHKTEFSNYKPGLSASAKEKKLVKVNLRKAALNWLEQNCFFERFGISPGQVFFCSDRQEKIARIKELGCTYFIDDLEEVFTEPGFPKGTVKMMFASGIVSGKIASDVLSFSSWSNIADYFFGTERIIEACSRLLGEKVLSLEQIGGGRNSRVFKLSTKNKIYLAKQYFKHPKEQRNRLEVEYKASEFLHKNQINCIPKPIAKDEKHNIAIYEFVKGKPVAEVTSKDMDCVFEFMSELKKLAAIPSSKYLPVAADACFSFQSIVDIIERRLKRLEAAAASNNSNSALIFEELNDFLESSFKPNYAKVLEWARKQAAKSKLGFSEEIKPELRTISPSDFGFHNTIRKKNGKLVFVDLEYFGTDSPMKLVSDFLLHDAMKLTGKQKHEFYEKSIALFKEDRQLKQRVSIAYPLFGLVWCLIFLNEFLGVDLQRREFAMQFAALNENRYKPSQYLLNIERERLAKQAEQLEKSRKMLKKILDEYQQLRWTQ